MSSVPIRLVLRDAMRLDADRVIPPRTLLATVTLEEPPGLPLSLGFLGSALQTGKLVDEATMPKVDNANEEVEALDKWLKEQQKGRK